MNSEELEQSLRTEFETYLKSVLAEVRQESAEFQEKIRAEFERHQAEFEETFRIFAARFDSSPELDEAFSSSVSEHLRLARDDGAKVAATAMAEAERLAPSAEPEPLPPPKYDAIRDAVNDISSKDSQSAILKSLVQHAAEFAPRGAFFIIKNEHFAGWKVFGAHEEAERAIREVHFPVEYDTILANAVKSLTTVESDAGRFTHDEAMLDPLGFGRPDRMMALPLQARGKGVAVMYVDRLDPAAEINREALETIIKVAGLTVELLASMQTAKEEDRKVGSADFEHARHEEEESRPAQPFSPPVPPTPPAEQPAAFSGGYPGFSFTESVPAETPYQAEPVMTAPEYQGFRETAQPEVTAEFRTGDEQHGFEPPAPVAEAQEQPAPAPAFEQPPFMQDFRSRFGSDTPSETSAPDQAFGHQPVPEDVRPQPADLVAPDASAFGSQASQYVPAVEARTPAYESERAVEPAPVAASPFDRAVEEYRPAGGAVGDSSSAPKGRLSDRPVDLPIEVPEGERRLHNDARRFARLLVSEIKLYNEKKVKEGRQAYDLYERLREAIDRSREMYDKRVQPPVAAKFDYFHYELLNSLADGNVERLGPGYPGASV